MSSPRLQSEHGRAGWPPFFWICYSMCVGVMGTALASPLYPLYQATWHLRPSEITHIFVVYMFGVLASLLFMGRLTARFGFLPILRSGLVLMTLGVLLSALAGSAPAFMLARLVIGVASGMISTSAAVGMVQSVGDRDPRRVSAVTTVAMTLGFGMGPLAGGLVAQWLPRPLVTAYVPSIFLGLLAVFALFRLENPEQAPAAGRDTARRFDWRAAIVQWLPALAGPPRAARRQFWIASFGAFSAFGMFSLYASLAPSFMGELVPWHGPAVSGAAIAAILFLSSAFQFLVRKWRTKTVVVLSGVGLAACNLLLAWTTRSHTAMLFAASVLVTAFGHGLASVGGMSVIGKLAHPRQRAGLLASYMIVGYLGTILPILAVGWLADHLGLARAVTVFACAMAVLSAAIASLAARTRELPVPADA